VRIRRAVESDATEIRRIHEAGIRDVCSRDYPAEVIAAWLSHKTDEHYRRRLSEQSFWIAEVDGRCVGFASTDLAGQRVEGLFVDPSVVGKGVAARLLAHLEALALDANIQALSLDSSLLALAFYLKRGYEPKGERSAIRLSSGVTVEGIPMTKRLSTDPSS
jgi:GNAT superfamily N-acetyltransferase